MWADTLRAAEQSHLLHLLAWGAASITAGTALVLVVVVRRWSSELLFHFAAQMAIWGGAILLRTGFGWSRVGLRDLAGFAGLDRSLWLAVGLDIGCVAVGLTLAVAGWKLGRRLAVVGAGAGVMTQGFGLLLLHLQFLATLSRIE